MKTPNIENQLSLILSLEKSKIKRYETQTKKRKIIYERKEEISDAKNSMETIVWIISIYGKEKIKQKIVFYRYKRENSMASNVTLENCFLKD